MIKTKNQLKDYLKYEKSLYIDSKVPVQKILTSDVNLLLWRFVVYLRKTEYYHNKPSFASKFLYCYYRRKKNKLGIKLGIEMWDSCIDKGLTIYHAGNIVINGMAKIGKDLKLHGSNCIGNDGITLDSPIIGDNVRLGVGAKVIGGITLADNITVAAGAVVVHSFEEPGITIGGIPAKKLSR
ncbi:hypothetical protein [uncultured Clostridium sp.]|uniref:hypothetical protein n=1 Tax=uncultured Clostridium sp. TaxID=59620 RepID=UPI0025E796C3|nr:hypothetical protein [uncultured Clostridium sp.]